MSQLQPTFSTPAFAKLLKAFDSLLDYEDALAGKNQGPSNVPLRNNDEVPIPPAFILSGGCEEVDLPDIPLDSRTCLVCFDSYHTIAAHLANDELIVAKRLPCGHLLCDLCLAKWFCPLNTDNNTCPYCRAEMFPKVPSTGMVEGVQARCDSYTWLAKLEDENETVPLSLRVMERKWKRCLVTARGHTATVEIAADRAQEMRAHKARLSRDHVSHDIERIRQQVEAELDWRRQAVEAIVEQCRVPAEIGGRTREEVKALEKFLREQKPLNERTVRLMLNMRREVMVEGWKMEGR